MYAEVCVLISYNKCMCVGKAYSIIRVCMPYINLYRAYLDFGILLRVYAKYIKRT